MTPEDESRAILLKALRAHSVTTVIAEYNGYGDEGEIYDVGAASGEATVNLSKIDGLSTYDLTEFFWTIVHDKHPGFENNEGGSGTVTWDVSGDKINLVHNENYTATETYEYGGL